MSRDFSSLSLPVPITISRGSVSPAGATMSRLDALLPVKRSAAAARRKRSPIGASARCVAGPNLKIFLTEHNENAARAREAAEAEFEGGGHESVLCRPGAVPNGRFAEFMNRTRGIVQRPRFGAESAHPEAAALFKRAY